MVYFWYSGKNYRGTHKEGYSGTKSSALSGAKRKGLKKFLLVKHADNSGRELSRHTFNFDKKQTTKRRKK